jgi:hypothetical protein
VAHDWWQCTVWIIQNLIFGYYWHISKVVTVTLSVNVFREVSSILWCGILSARNSRIFRRIVWHLLLECLTLKSKALFS